jgi:hypothetical protein
VTCCGRRSPPRTACSRATGSRQSTSGSASTACGARSPHFAARPATIVAYTSAQIGHTDPRFTLRCYTKATRRRERLSGPHRKAYDRALEWAQMGTGDAVEAEPGSNGGNKSPV